MQELTYLIAQREEARQRLDWNRSQAEEYAERAKADKDEIQMLDVWIGRFDDGTNPRAILKSKTETH